MIIINNNDNENEKETFKLEIVNSRKYWHLFYINIIDFFNNIIIISTKNDKLNENCTNNTLIPREPANNKVKISSTKQELNLKLKLLQQN